MDSLMGTLAEKSRPLHDKGYAAAKKLYSYIY